MLKNRLRLNSCGRILAVVILLSFLKFPMYAEPPMTQEQNSTENETRLYSGSEVETLIDEVSQAAYEAIEQAAGEAAKAALLESIEREAEAYREAARWRTQAEINAMEIKTAKKNGAKNAVIAGLVCLLCGLAVGIGGTIIVSK